MTEGDKKKMVCPGCGGEVQVGMRGIIRTGCGVTESVNSWGYCRKCDRKVERVQRYNPDNGNFVSEKTHFYGPRKASEVDE